MTQAKIDAYYAAAKTWAEAKAELRRIVLDEGLDEAWKWATPVYTVDGTNVAIVNSLKSGAVFGFFNGALLADPDGVLEKPGENSRAARMASFTDAAGVRAAEPALRALIREAVANAKSGRKVDFNEGREIDYPGELTSRLEADEAFREAFESLTPGRKRSWLLHYTGAKQAATRAARIEKSAAKVMAGKGQTER